MHVNVFSLIFCHTNSHKLLFSFSFQVPQCPTPPPEPQCDPKSNVRSVDGLCNNLNHPTWGSTLQPFLRFLAPEYADGRYVECRILQ